VGGNGAVIPPISDCKYSSVEQKCYDLVKPIIQSTKLKIASKFLRWSCRGTKWGEDLDKILKIQEKLPDMFGQVS